MERRSFVRGAGLGGLAGVLATGAAPAVHARDLIRWRYAIDPAQPAGAAADATAQLARHVAALTGGRFQIEAEAGTASALPADRAIDAVRAGRVDVAHVAASDLLALGDAFALAAPMPFGPDARQLDAWLLAGRGQALLRALHAEHGLVQLPGGHGGAPLGGWFRRPLARADEWRGLRVHASGMVARVLARLGADVRALPANEALAALRRGDLDAGVFGGPHDDRQLGLHRVASHCAFPAWGDSGCRCVFLIHAGAHASLSRQDQAALEAAARQVHADRVARYDVLNPLALRELAAGGTRLFFLPADAVQAAVEAKQAMCAELCACDGRFRALFDDQLQALAQMAPWQRVAADASDAVPWGRRV